jgi:hypothetical protein
MRRKIISLLISFTIITLTSCQNRNEQGLVAHYPLDGDFKDLSGNSHDIRVHEAVLTKDRFGRENSACFFNGISTNILAQVKNMPAVDHAQTISWWFMIEQPPDYVDSLGADNMITLVDTVQGIGLQFGYRAPGYHTLGLDTWYWGGRTVLGVAPTVTNKWHHCVYTYDGQVHRYFIDGQEIAQSSVKPQSGTPNTLMFGNYPSGDQFFAGSLDDIKIYNRVLKPSEIETLYKVKE